MLVVQNVNFPWSRAYSVPPCLRASPTDEVHRLRNCSGMCFCFDCRSCILYVAGHQQCTAQHLNNVVMRLLSSSLCKQASSTFRRHKAVAVCTCKLEARGISCRSRATIPIAAAARPHVIVLTGPTAVGKTQLSLALAQQLRGEIISADSVQVYTGLDIGSDKVGAGLVKPLRVTAAWFLNCTVGCADKRFGKAWCASSFARHSSRGRRVFGWPLLRGGTGCNTGHLAGLGYLLQRSILTVTCLCMTHHRLYIRQSAPMRNCLYILTHHACSPFASCLAG